jgi:hypothetical protein
MWGMRPCAEDDVAVFTENREGLIHLKTYKVASSAEGPRILPIAADQRGGRERLISAS